MKIEIDNIELSFADKKILYGIFLKAETGKVSGILGRNGCGKTSLLKILFGSLKSKYANVRLNGIHQKNKLFKSGKVAFLPQHQMLPRNITVIKSFSFFNLNWDSFLEDFHSFKKYENTKVNELSPGELRIIETYLILSSKKEIILLDEPFSYVAPLYVEKIKNLIIEKKKESAIIVTDHFYKDILEISDSIYFIKNGYSKIIKTVEDLADESYLGKLPRGKPRGYSFENTI